MSGCLALSGCHLALDRHEIANVPCSTTVVHGHYQQYIIWHLVRTRQYIYVNEYICKRHLRARDDTLLICCGLASVMLHATDHKTTRHKEQDNTEGRRGERTPLKGQLISLAKWRTLQSTTRKRNEISIARNFGFSRFALLLLRNFPPLMGAAIYKASIFM